MKKILNNKYGMTLVEVLVAVSLLVLMIWTFAPFVASTFKQIAQAGTLHIGLAGDISTIDNQIADEYFGAPATFPVKVGGDPNIDVGGIHLSSGELHTFYSHNTSYLSTDDILYEGYGSDQFYNAYYSIGFLPEISDKKFFKNDHTYVVTLTDANGNEYVVAEEFDILHTDPKNDIDPDSVTFGDHLFIVASQFPDGVGGNPDKIGYLLIVPDSLGLDNPNSPYELMITTKETGQNFIDEPVSIEVMLPLYQAVGTYGMERIASHINYWVDKFTYTSPNHSTSGGDPVHFTRLPGGVTFNDVLWYEDDTQARYYTVGDYSTIKESWADYNWNLWYREHEEPWKQPNIIGGATGNLNRIKRLGGYFVAIGDNGLVVISSDDGLTWYNKTIPGATGKNLEAFSYDGTNFIILASDGTAYGTTDFNSYNTYATTTSGIDTGFASLVIKDMVFTGSYFMAVGEDNYMSVSDEGEFWTVLDKSTTVSPPVGHNNFNCIYIYKSTGYILGEEGQIHRFNTGTTGPSDWVTVINHSEGAEDLNDMAYSRKAFVIVGDSGKIMYSLDGGTWTDCNTMEGFATDLGDDIMAVAGRN